MNILVIGCGKVGSRLAGVLCKQGHDVSVICNEENLFETLPDEFTGFTTLGVPIDLEVLKKAGIENCDALAAVTQDDNVNIMVSQIAKEFFHTPIVLTRIIDPKRGDVFSQFGLHTICPTNLMVSAVCSSLMDTKQKNINIGSHTLSFVTMDIPRQFIDLKVSEIHFENNEILYAVERSSKLILVGLNDMILLKGDKLIFSKLID